MKFKNSIINLIKVRKSCRTYSSNEISPKSLNEIEKLIKQPSIGPFGTKPRFILINLNEMNSKEKRKLGTYGIIKGARYFILSVCNRLNTNLVDLGYSFEEIIIKLTELSFGTVWISGTFRKKEFEKSTKLLANEYIPAISPFGYPLNKYNVIDSFIQIGIKPRKRKNWSELFFKGDFSNPLNEAEASNFKIPLEMVRLAPSGQNKQPWRILKEVNSNSFYFYVKSGEKQISLMNKIDIGIALCHFDLVTKELEIKGRWSNIKPNIEHHNNMHYICSWLEDLH